MVLEAFDTLFNKRDYRRRGALLGSMSVPPCWLPEEAGMGCVVPTAERPVCGPVKGVCPRLATNPGVTWLSVHSPTVIGSLQFHPQSKQFLLQPDRLGIFVRIREFADSL
jgi:hypothetical protein